MSWTRQFKRILAAAALMAICVSSGQAAEIAAEDAAKHVGESATVCGDVASARYAEQSKTQPTFLNLGRPYPNQTFTVVIFSADRAKFGTPERTLLRRRICATGEIRLFQGRPEIVVSDPAQIVSLSR